MAARRALPAGNQVHDEPSAGHNRCGAAGHKIRQDGGARRRLATMPLVWLSMVALMDRVQCQQLAAGKPAAGSLAMGARATAGPLLVMGNASAHANRPIDRPSLAAAATATATRSQNSTRALDRDHDDDQGAPQDWPTDWLLMGGADLQPEEARSSAAFMEPQAPALGNRSAPAGQPVAVRRSGSHHHRPRKTAGSGGRSGAGNRSSLFDDEQAADAADSNEVYDDPEEGATLAGSQKEPECAGKGRYYCTYKEDYPIKLVTEVTKYYKWPLEKLFRDLHAQIMPKLAPDSVGNLVCDSITRVVRPGWARNTNERWLVVINTDSYHQYVTEVVCQYGSNSRCNFIPPCYYSSCQQRYNTQKLLVIDPSNPYRGPFLSEFLFPSCCVCYVPTSSDSYQDRYRSSPATIYQRTMQQDASNNLYPPQFKPPGLVEEPMAGSSVSADSLPPSGSPSSSSASSGAPSGAPSSGRGPHAVPAGQLAGAPLAPSGPGEIRRAGDLYALAPKTRSLATSRHSHPLDSQADALNIAPDEAYLAPQAPSSGHQVTQ